MQCGFEHLAEHRCKRHSCQDVISCSLSPYRKWQQDDFSVWVTENGNAPNKKSEDRTKGSSLFVFSFFPPKVHGKSYFRVEDYIPASRIEKMTLAYVQRELAKLHRMNRSLFEDEAELEFLKVTCHTPDSIYLFS